MTDRRLGPRASALSFIGMTLLATTAATGLFVLLDPRAQAFWAARFGELAQAVRRLFGG